MVGLAGGPTVVTNAVTTILLAMTVLLMHLIRKAWALPTGTEAMHTKRPGPEEMIERQLLLFENLTDGVMILDSGGRIIDWNTVAERISRMRGGV